MKVWYKEHRSYITITQKASPSERPVLTPCYVELTGPKTITLCDARLLLNWVFADDVWYRGILKAVFAGKSYGRWKKSLCDSPKNLLLQIQGSGHWDKKMKRGGWWCSLKRKSCCLFLCKSTVLLFVADTPTTPKKDNLHFSQNEFVHTSFSYKLLLVSNHPMNEIWIW